MGYRLLIIADSKIAVPPVGYGGVERVVGQLCEELGRRGHQVTLMAKAGSRNYGRLVAYPWGGSGPKPWRAACKLWFLLRSWIETRRRPDAVIAYCRTDYLGSVQASGLPLLYDFQNPVEPDQVAMLTARERGPLALAGLSRAHVGPGREPPLWRVIHNPSDPSRLPFCAEPKGGYLAFLGRLTRNKGLDTAINVAERTGQPLKIAGNVSDVEEDRRFFDDEIRPRLRGNIEWIGEIDDVRKASFLGDARALLVPIRWSEPFGIIVAESFACGTPVLAMACGSMPELIDSGTTGFLATTEDEMVAQIARIGELDRAACRAAAEQRFAVPRIVDEYLAVIAELIARRGTKPPAS